MATPSRAAAVELSAPAGAGPRDGGERGRGVDGLGDGGAGDRGRGAGARGRCRAVDNAGDWGLGAPRLRFGAVEWRLRIGARARGKKGKQGSTVGSSPHPAVLMIYTAGSSPHPAVFMIYTAGPKHHPAVLSVYTAGSTPNPAVLSPCRHFTCPLHSRQSGGKYGSNPFTTYN